MRCFALLTVHMLLFNSVEAVLHGSAAGQIEIEMSSITFHWFKPEPITTASHYHLFAKAKTA